MYTDCATLRSYINNRVITSLRLCRAPGVTAKPGAVTLISTDTRRAAKSLLERETQDSTNATNHKALKIILRDVTAPSSQSWAVTSSIGNTNITNSGGGHARWVSLNYPRIITSARSKVWCGLWGCGGDQYCRHTDRPHSPTNTDRQTDR